MSNCPGCDTSGYGWPEQLGRGAVRWAYRSRRYEATVAFYRDLVGLPVIAEFSSSYGEDGTIVGLPGTQVHLEILRERTSDLSSVGHQELVLYLEGAQAVHSATTGLREAGIAPDRPGHPYWQANGAITYRDPDGRTVVFAPWVFGRVPDPVDRPSPLNDTSPEANPHANPNAGTGENGSVRIRWYNGDREALRALFEEAEDSSAQLDSYLREGRILVALLGDDVVGHLQLVDTVREAEIELKSMAVTPERRGTGIGKRMVEHAITASRADGYHRMAVATAAADIDNLRFYQRRGFRFTAVEPDAFDADAGYPAGITVHGIPLIDRVWLAQPL